MIVRIIALFLAMAQLPLLAQGSAAPAAAAPSGTGAGTTTVANPAGEGIKSLLLMVIFGLGMYFLLIAPQRKKEKELKNTLQSLKPGDKVVTNSGILGIVVSLNDKTLSIRSADTKLEILKSSVLEIVERAGGSESAEAKKIAEKSVETAK
jgi:preprotein translocase subunit YajC